MIIQFTNKVELKKKIKAFAFLNDASACEVQLKLIATGLTNKIFNSHYNKIVDMKKNKLFVHNKYNEEKDGVKHTFAVTKFKCELAINDKSAGFYTNPFFK